MVLVKTATSFTEVYILGEAVWGFQVSSASSLLADTEERKFATWGSLKPRCKFWHLPSQSLKSELALSRGVCLLRKVGVCSDESESVTLVKTGLPSGLVALARVGVEGLGRGWKGEQQDPPFACPHCWDFSSVSLVFYVHKAEGTNRLLINQLLTEAAFLCG